VLASRLSEDGHSRVLLLEAGSDWRSADAPEAMRNANPVPLLAWTHVTPYYWPQLKARRTVVQEPIHLWRGRGLGGSSAINFQVAIRGTLEDFDTWAAEGCTGWSGEEVMPYFVRLEDDLNFGDQPYHGQGGPIPISRAPLAEWGAVGRALRTAALDLGYVWAEDHNAPGSTGVSPYAANRRNERRVTTNDGYLEPARSRGNLTIVGNAHVDKVLFAVGGQQATGVRVRVDHEWQEIQGREVILCAGAVHSPAILLRSGIGPAAELAALGIPCRNELPVGENLQDHPTAWLNLQLKPSARVRSLQMPFTNCCIRYTSGLAQAGPNDMMMIAANLSFASVAPHHLTSEGRLNLDEAYESVQGAFALWVNRCFSRGKLRITSTDPDLDPDLDEKMLGDERDLLRMREGVGRMFTIGRHPAVQAIVEAIHIGAERSMEDLRSQDEIDDWLLHTAGSGAHPVGTCRMGAVNDPRSVVDPDGRVIGLAGLRVVDASIMPDVPRANTHLTCVMIGEYMAERIKRTSRSWQGHIRQTPHTAQESPPATK
jgi:choline dehydrogenase